MIAETLPYLLARDIARLIGCIVGLLVLYTAVRSLLTGEPEREIPNWLHSVKWALVGLGGALLGFVTYGTDRIFIQGEDVYSIILLSGWVALATALSVRFVARAEARWANGLVLIGLIVGGGFASWLDRIG